jgi:hypothetical protein
VTSIAGCSDWLSQSCNGPGVNRYKLHGLQSPRARNMLHYLPGTSDLLGGAERRRFDGALWLSWLQLFVEAENEDLVNG